ncbi:MAG TPA: MGMT family protein [Syntrophales bacterium]|nr:MGMT family protein [Syntrophales bacterium]
MKRLEMKTEEIAVPTSMGTVTVLMSPSSGKGRTPVITEIRLPRKGRGGAGRSAPSGTSRKGGSPVPWLAALEDLLRDGKATFPLDALDWGACTPFQEKVLRELARVPLGKVISYGALARRAGVPRAARAVGAVMAWNPFPLVFPCHRVVRSSGETGRYGGGEAMKRALLKREGVRIDGAGRVDPAHRIE